MKATEESFKGFLVSCDKNREKEAVKEAYNFLQEFIERAYNDITEENIRKKIKEEGKQLSLENEVKQSRRKEIRLLSQVETNVNCLCFIKINPAYKQIDPLVIVSLMMKEVHEEGRAVGRYCHRILPVERAFRAQHFRMLQELDELFFIHSQPQEIRSWMLHFRCRNNSKFNYKEILREVQVLTKKYQHFPDIYYPQWAVSIEIVNHLMCLSICEGFKETNQFKLHSAVKEEGKAVSSNKSRERSPKGTKAEENDEKEGKGKKGGDKEKNVEKVEGGENEKREGKAEQNVERGSLVRQVLEEKQEDVDII